MSLLDTFTDGYASSAEDDLRQARQLFAGIQTPTAQQLTLPQLEQFVQAGIMTPEEAKAYTQDSSAFQDQNINQTGNANTVAALSDLGTVSDAGPMGTPEEQAQVSNAIDQMNGAVRGQRGAIEQAAEARGTPAALVQAALADQSVGQDAQQAHRDALQAQAQAYQQAVAAMAERGQMGQTYQGNLNTQANTTAGAIDAMKQFNARNQQQSAQFNAANKQAANLYNTTNAQDVSNKNVSQGNARTTYNAGLPQQVFEDQMAKAGGESGVATNQAKLAQEQGQQTAGIYSGLIGGASNLMGDYMTSSALSKAMGSGGAAESLPIGAVAEGGILSHEGCYHDGGICMDDGGMVPGAAKHPGDSLQNDTVHVMASPGEAVIPRSSVQKHLPEVMALIGEARKPNTSRETMGHHPEDVATLLHALKAIRMGAA